MSAPRRTVCRRPYLLPQPCDTLEDWERLNHLDEPYLSPLERWAEHRAAADALAELVRSGRRPTFVVDVGKVVDARAWLAERVRATRRRRP